MKKLVLFIAALGVIAPTLAAQEIKQAPDTTKAKETLKSQEPAEAPEMDPNFNPKNKTTTDVWTVVEEGDDEIGHYITETTYQKGVYVSSSTGKSWTLTAAIGTQFYLGDNDWKGKFCDLITGPAIDLYVNKWISPVFGIGIGFTYNPFRGLYQKDWNVAAFKTDEFYMTYNGYQQLYRQKGHTFNPYVIAMVDLDNLFGGYKPKRIYNLAFYAGGGVIFGNDPVQTRCGATFNVGFMNLFRVGRYLDILLNLRGGLVSDSFDGESRLTEPQTKDYIRANVPFDGVLGLTAGIVYHFGTKDREWSNVSNVTKTYTGYAEAKKEIKNLQNQLATAKGENEKLMSQMAEKTVIKEPTDLWYHVQFVVDKWDISNRERVNLKAIADQIKASPDTKFSICGYADIQTATPSHNLTLSKNRVNQVYKVLTKEFGVNPDQLIKDFKGGVDLMFYDENTLSRCVIIKTAE